MPKISLVVPIYNVESYIEKCLISIKVQSFKDFECICVDDCGNDNSIAIAQNFVDIDSRFKIVHHDKNRGLSAARNTGIENAKGELIVFVDSDDWVDNLFLEQVVKGFENNNIDSVWYNARVVSEKNNNFTTIFNSRLFESDEGFLDITPKNINLFPDFAWNKAYKKEVLDRYNLRFCEGLYFEDSEFYIKAYTNFSKIYYIRKPLYNYRQRENSIVSSKEGRNKKNEHLFLTIEKNYDYLVQNGKFEEWKEVLLEIFTRRIWSVLIKNERDNIIRYANKTLEYIDFPFSYKGLDSENFNN
jgi:glycosyltransferase involved in cell wall biosynthesis